MRSTIMIKEHLSMHDARFTVHIINVEDHPKGGWYVQIGSIEAMVERSSKRWYHYWHEKKYATHKTQVKFDRWRIGDENIYNATKERIAKLDSELANELYPEIIKVNHCSVWDFLNSIKYDYKDKKVASIDSLIHIEGKNS